MSQLKTVSAKKLMGQVSGFALAVAGVALFSTAAQAGFEWTPPVKPMAAPAAPADGALMPEMPAIPRDHVEAIDMTAAVTAAPAAPVPAYVPADAPAIPASPLLQPTPQIPSNPFPVAAPAEPAPRTPSQIPAADTVSSAPLMANPAAMSSSGYEQVEGFGSDIPLALAMRQIVPAQYAYVFSGNVDQGTRVTWNGGKPWNEVLADAIRPQGLDLSVSGQTVRVFPQGQMPAPAQLSASASDAPMLTGISSDASATTDPVREVYVRRNSSSGPVAAERAPGEPAVTSANTPVVLTADSVANKPKGKSGFWSHFGLDSSETTTIRNEDKVVSQQGAASPVAPAPKAPATPYAPHTPSASAPQQLSAEMHDSQVYESHINEPLSLTADTVTAEKISTAGNPYMMNFWSAEKGESLRHVLQSWSDNAGVQLQWSAQQDYVLAAPVRLQGSYTDALTQVLGAYDENGPRPLGRLHPNLPAGPSVLIIEGSNG